jgi:hypothetical protein
LKKNSSNHELKKSAQKCLRKSRKWIILPLKIGDDLTQTHGCIDTNQEFTLYGNHPTSFHSLQDWGDLSLLSSLL